MNEDTAYTYIPLPTPYPRHGKWYRASVSGAVGVMAETHSSILYLRTAVWVHGWLETTTPSVQCVVCIQR